MNDPTIEPMEKLFIADPEIAARVQTVLQRKTRFFERQAAAIMADETIWALSREATFGKALGSYGAYAAASREFVDFLVNKARTFIYSTALPPAVVGATLASLYLVESEPQFRIDLHAKVAFFKKQLRKNGFKGDTGPSQIIPVMVGDSSKALAIAEELQKNHIYVKAVRPPTVPEGSARLRFSITRYHQEEDLKRCAQLLAASLRKISA